MGRPGVMVALVLACTGLAAQESVPALGQGSDAAQRMFDRGFQPATDTVYGQGGVEVEPVFNAEGKDVNGYLAAHIHYPEEAGKDKLQGRVHVRFIVRPDGSVDDVELVRGVHPLLDAEAIRVVRGMPRWKPGLMHGKPVPVRMVLPVGFVPGK